MLDAQLGRRRRKSDAVLGDASESAGVFREHFLDDECGLEEKLLWILWMFEENDFKLRMTLILQSNILSVGKLIVIY